MPKSIKLIDGKHLIVNIVSKKLDDILTLQTDESYKIKASEVDNEIVININASTIFGARHALETLSQLIVFDDIRSELQVSIFSLFLIIQFLKLLCFSKDCC